MGHHFFWNNWRWCPDAHESTENQITDTHHNHYVWRSIKDDYVDVSMWWWDFLLLFFFFFRSSFATPTIFLYWLWISCSVYDRILYDYKACKREIRKKWGTDDNHMMMLMCHERVVLADGADYKSQQYTRTSLCIRTSRCSTPPLLFAGMSWKLNQSSKSQQ